MARYSWARRTLPEDCLEYEFDEGTRTTVGDIMSAVEKPMAHFTHICSGCYRMSLQVRSNNEIPEAEETLKRAGVQMETTAGSDCSVCNKMEDEGNEGKTVLFNAVRRCKKLALYLYSRREYLYYNPLQETEFQEHIRKFMRKFFPTETIPERRTKKDRTISYTHFINEIYQYTTGSNSFEETMKEIPDEKEKEWCRNHKVKMDPPEFRCTMKMTHWAGTTAESSWFKDKKSARDDAAFQLWVAIFNKKALTNLPSEDEEWEIGENDKELIRRVIKKRKDKITTEKKAKQAMEIVERKRISQKLAEESESKRVAEEQQKAIKRIEEEKLFARRQRRETRSAEQYEILRENERARLALSYIEREKIWADAAAVRRRTMETVYAPVWDLDIPVKPDPERDARIKEMQRNVAPPKPRIQQNVGGSSSSSSSKDQQGRPDNHDTQYDSTTRQKEWARVNPPFDWNDLNMGPYRNDEQPRLSPAEERRRAEVRRIEGERSYFYPHVPKVRNSFPAWFKKDTKNDAIRTEEMLTAVGEPRWKQFTNVRQLVELEPGHVVRLCGLKKESLKDREAIVLGRINGAKFIVAMLGTPAWTKEFYSVPGTNLAPHFVWRIGGMTIKLEEVIEAREYYMGKYSQTAFMDTLK